MRLPSLSTRPVAFVVERTVEPGPRDGAVVGAGDLETPSGAVW